MIGYFNSFYMFSITAFIFIPLVFLVRWKKEASFRQLSRMRRMFKIRHIAVDHFKVPLPLALSDSTHGEITHFGLVTVRLTDAQGREGLGYTYTVNNIGAPAISTLIEQDLSELCYRQTLIRLKLSGRKCGGMSILLVVVD
ncbi:MAG: hypothetical protein CM1200mP41_39350 [Gammaproteobacteria bacterium]|nr:MAG: hypothetical protein CM1200mP41_39350 [Gammaproteobacteria bacterium]